MTQPLELIDALEQAQNNSIDHAINAEVMTEKYLAECNENIRLRTEIKKLQRRVSILENNPE